MKIDRWFVLLALLTLAVAVVLLWREWNQSSAASNQAAIGYLEYTRSTVQRRSVRSTLFEPANREFIIRNEDTVRTGANSRAIVRLQDGTEIAMTELCMLRLRVTGGAVQLDHHAGIIRVRRTNTQLPLEIQTKKNSVRMQAGDAQINATSEEVKALHGEVQVGGPDGRFRTVRPSAEQGSPDLHFPPAPARGTSFQNLLEEGPRSSGRSAAPAPGKTPPAGPGAPAAPTGTVLD